MLSIGSKSADTTIWVKQETSQNRAQSEVTNLTMVADSKMGVGGLMHKVPDPPPVAVAVHLSPEQTRVLDMVKCGRNVFFTGPAGKLWLTCKV